MYTNIKTKIIIYLLAVLFLIVVSYRTYKSNKYSWLHEYKVIRGINWKDKLKEAKKTQEENHLS